MSIGSLMPSLRWLKTYSASKLVPYNLGTGVLRTCLPAKSTKPYISGQFYY
jgi:hypothetical protein